MTAQVNGEGALAEGSDVEIYVHAIHGGHENRAHSDQLRHETMPDQAFYKILILNMIPPDNARCAKTQKPQNRERSNQKKERLREFDIIAKGGNCQRRQESRANPEKTRVEKCCKINRLYPL